MYIHMSIPLPSLPPPPSPPLPPLPHPSPSFFGSAGHVVNRIRRSISVIEDVLGYRVHVGLALERGSGGWSWFRRSLEHAGLGRLQQAAVARRSPVNRANRLLASYVAYCSTDQHLESGEKKKRRKKE